MNRRLMLFTACLAVLGCTVQAPTTTPTPPTKEDVLRGGIKPTIVKAPSPVPDAFFGRPAGAPLIANNGAAIVSNGSSSLVGVVRAPAILMSDKGAGIISNNAGAYHLQSTSEVPAGGLDVMLVTANGTPVVDDKGNVITAKTDAQGKYKLPFTGNMANLVVRVALGDQKGSLLAFVARRDGAGDRTINVDLESTFVMGYILGQYVKGDQAVLEKLPEDAEAETRTKMAQALEKSTAAPPSALNSDQIGKAVDALRAQDATLSAQLETIKRILLVGLSDQGAGQPATSVETDALALALSPTGEVFYGGLNTSRVWRRDAQGLLRPFAGSGGGVPAGQRVALTPDQPSPGDGGPATAAAISPAAIAFDKAGNLFIADPLLKRVRKVDAAGVITTVAARADWSDLCGLAVAADGSLVVATKLAVDKVAPDKTITRLAGGTRGVPAAGATSALKFRGIWDVAIDPANGQVLVLDESGLVMRLADATATLEVGTGTPGFSGDGGSASKAAISGTGGLAFAPDGALMLADLGNRRIRRIKDGNIATVAGTGAFGFGGDGGSAAQAAMVNPRSLRVAGDGTAYTADTGFVRRLKDGTLDTVIGKLSEAGAQPLAKVQLRNPRSLWYDAQAHAILFTELWRVRRWNLADDSVETITSAGLSGAPFQEGGAPTASTLFNFYGLAMGPDGALTLLADDVGFKRRLLRQQGGKLVTLAGNGQDSSLFGLMLQLDGPAKDAAIPTDAWPVAVKGDQAFYGIYLGDSVRKAIVATLTPGGNVTELCRVDSPTQLTALAVSPDGTNLYIGLLEHIYRYEFASKQLFEVAKNGGAGTPDELGLPSGFAWDKAGNLYFADYASAGVRRIPKDGGTIKAIAGKGAPLLNQDAIDDGLSGPWGVALDRDGNLYISDMGANQIKKIPASKLP